MKTIILFILSAFIINTHKSYSQNSINSECDSLLCVFITENWKYVKDGDYFEFKDDNAKNIFFTHCIAIKEDRTKQPFIDCIRNMTQLDFISLLGVPNEINHTKALTYYLSPIKEFRDPPSYCLKIIFENDKFYCTMIF